MLLMLGFVAVPHTGIAADPQPEPRGFLVTSSDWPVADTVWLYIYVDPNGGPNACSTGTMAAEYAFGSGRTGLRATQGRWILDPDLLRTAREDLDLTVCGRLAAAGGFTPVSEHELQQLLAAQARGESETQLVESLCEDRNRPVEPASMAGYVHGGWCSEPHIRIPAIPPGRTRVRLAGFLVTVNGTQVEIERLPEVRGCCLADGCHDLDVEECRRRKGEPFDKPGVRCNSPEAVDCPVEDETPSDERRGCCVTGYRVGDLLSDHCDNVRPETCRMVGGRLMAPGSFCTGDIEKDCPWEEGPERPQRTSVPRPTPRPPPPPQPQPDTPDPNEEKPAGDTADPNEEKRGCCISGTCEERPEEECKGLGGTPLPTGAMCTGDDAVDCPGEAPAPELGGCCDGAGSCSPRSKDACLPPKIFFAAGCPEACPVLGTCFVRCPVGDAETCVDSTQEDCLAVGGRFESGVRCPKLFCPATPCSAAVGGWSWLNRQGTAVFGADGSARIEGHPPRHGRWECTVVTGESVIQIAWNDGRVDTLRYHRDGDYEALCPQDGSCAIRLWSPSRPSIGSSFVLATGQERTVSIQLSNHTSSPLHGVDVSIAGGATWLRLTSISPADLTIAAGKTAKVSLTFQALDNAPDGARKRVTVRGADGGRGASALELGETFFDIVAEKRILNVKVDVHPRRPE